MDERRRSRGRWTGMTWYLFFCCMVYNFGDIIFGIDTGSFGSLQALPSWLQVFGQRQASGMYTLPTGRAALMNSLPWIGKIFGTMAFEPILEKVGFRISMIAVCFVQIVAVIIEITAKTWEQFTVGRILAYLGVGIVENLVPTYEAELAPASLRGFLAGNVQVVVILGNIWGSGMSRAFANETAKKGWLIPVGMQFIPAVLLLAFLPFTVESPRWLVSHGRREEAIRNLDRVRPKEDVLGGITVAEIEAVEMAIEEAKTKDKGRWIDLFRGTYFRRTMIICWIFFFQETTGQQFFNSYAATFFKSSGLGAKSFTYTTVGQVAGLVAVLIAVLTTDIVGRRFLCILGTGLGIGFNLVGGNLGSIPASQRTSTQINTTVASLILVNAVAKLGVSSQAFLIGSEIGGTQMRKKTIAAGTTADVLSAFLVTFATPYIQNPPGVALGAKVAYVFGGVAAVAFLFCIFFLPELKGRSLEEVDELFERKLWAWQFASAETYGIGARIARIELGERKLGEEAPDEHVQGERMQNPARGSEIT